MQKKTAKTTILVVTTFLLFKIGNLFLADIAFNKGYKANLGGKYKQSVELIEQAINLNRHEPIYYRELADSYCMLGQTDKCLKNASKAIEINPQNLLTLKALTKTFIRTGLIENAQVMSEKLLEVCPSDEESRQLQKYITQLLPSSNLLTPYPD